MPASVSMSMGACDLEWLPMVWPSSAIRRANAGLELAQRPWMKKVARVPAAPSASRIAGRLPGVHGKSGCSVSMVRAMRALIRGWSPCLRSRTRRE